MKKLICSLAVVLSGLMCVMVSEADCDSLSPDPSELFFFAPSAPLTISQAAPGESSPIGQSSELTGETKLKSQSRAVLYSLLLPGLGEIYVGDSRTRAAAFLTAEVGIVSSLVLFKHLGKWKKNDYVEFAVVYAGVHPEGKDDRFWDMVGFHDSRDDYNKVSRVYSRENPFYPETPEWDWQWQSVAGQQSYREMKNDSKSYYRAANFAIAAAALNRAVSMFFAWRSAKAHNRRVADDLSSFELKITPTTSSGAYGINVQLAKSF
jgi:hypothetical protein